jgi:hypothetical protein
VNEGYWHALFYHSISRKWYYSCRDRTLDGVLNYVNGIYERAGYDWPNIYIVVDQKEYDHVWRAIVTS